MLVLAYDRFLLLAKFAKAVDTPIRIFLQSSLLP